MPHVPRAPQVPRSAPCSRPHFCTSALLRSCTCVSPHFCDSVTVPALSPFNSSGHYASTTPVRPYALIGAHAVSNAASRPVRITLTTQRSIPNSYSYRIAHGDTHAKLSYIFWILSRFLTRRRESAITSTPTQSNAHIRRRAITEVLTASLTRVQWCACNPDLYVVQSLR